MATQLMSFCFMFCVDAPVTCLTVHVPIKCFCLQCKLELHDVNGTVDHGTAFGRIAFACPRDQVKYYLMDASLYLLKLDNYNPIL